MLIMEQLLEYRQRLLERFEAVSEQMERLLKDEPAQDWHTPLDPESWTPHQILAHVRDAEMHEFFPCIQSILDQETPLSDCFDREAWMSSSYRPDEPLEAIRNDLQGLNARKLERLRDLPSAGWSRTGRHPTWGLRSLQWWVEQSLSHTEEHLKQVMGDK